MTLLAAKTASHATLTDELDVSIQDIRVAMQECGVLLPEKVIEDEIWDGEEDVRGVENFVAWCTGKQNQEIRRIALEGAADEAKEDYLSGQCSLYPTFSTMAN
jgi:transcription initiation factor TFIID subunit 3